jgi:hypothetical protein
MSYSLVMFGPRLWHGLYRSTDGCYNTTNYFQLQSRRVHVILLLVFLPISALFAVFAVCMFVINAWARAVVAALEGRLIAAGVWACVGIFMVNVLNAVVNGAEWHDMMPLYVSIAILALGGTIAKHVLSGRYTNRLPSAVAARPVYLARFECLSTAL